MIKLPTWFRIAGGWLACVAVGAAGQLPAGLDLIAGGGGPDSPHVRASLVAERPAVAPGGAVRVGLRLRVDDGWHVYWKHPGEAGLPPRVKWSLPAGVSVSDFTWPLPERHETDGGVVTHVLEGDVLLPVTLRLDDAFAEDTLTLGADASWLACDAVCLPGAATLRLTLTVSPAAAVAEAVDAAGPGGAFADRAEAFAPAGPPRRVTFDGDAGPAEIVLNGAGLRGLHAGGGAVTALHFGDDGSAAVAVATRWHGAGLAVEVPAAGGGGGGGVVVVRQGDRRTAVRWVDASSPPSGTPAAGGGRGSGVGGG